MLRFLFLFTVAWFTISLFPHWLLAIGVALGAKSLLGV